MSFKAVSGYFAAYPNKGFQGLDSSQYDHLQLISHKDWKELYDDIPKDTQNCHYKLLILARHGQGYHNAAILRYGMKEWDAYWSLLPGDEHGEWLDSRLTPLGKNEVRRTGSNVLLPITKQLGILPDVFFSSPMRRCLETFIESWTPVLTEVQNASTRDEISPRIIESLRETLGSHTCDKRVAHSMATDEYQGFCMESGHTVHWEYVPDYPEEDELWLADHRETCAELDIRTKDGLFKLFSQLSKEEKFISLTCHSGVIQSVLRNLKHPPIFNLETGKVVGVVVEVPVNTAGQGKL
ncbi:pmu1p [Saccharomyces arboricola H-6]|uniref:Pmu1p n=1 Tax=Saccharomyces arboricola (strain H-6 / AS 2.3317 / CBS 10644) TaxID=1160507 RepID=J8Q2R5_SACAR|nr:pmu1p [Saccharomyces arboricola H-6]